MEEMSAVLLVLEGAMQRRKVQPCAGTCAHSGTLSDKRMYCCKNEIHLVRRKRMDRYRENQDLFLKVHFDSMKQLRYRVVFDRLTDTHQDDLCESCRQQPRTLRTACRTCTLGEATYGSGSISVLQLDLKPGHAMVGLGG